MDNKSIRPGVWLTVVGSLAVLILVLALLDGQRSPRPAGPESAKPAPPSQPEADPSRMRTETRQPRPAAAANVEQPEYIEGLVYGDIDLREARELMPDNLYWKLGSPTKDEKVLAERDAERKQRNEEYGRVLAGDASEDEVRAYYDYRKQLSADYLEFSEFMARRHKGKGPEEFVNLLNLAVKMHSERLAQLPAELDDALQRSREREKVREDWRRQQEEFGPMGGEPSEEDEELR